MRKKKDTHDFKVRGIPQKDWDLFMQHCREESLNRGMTISANKRIIEMIKVVASTVKPDSLWEKENQKTLF
ncbi:hypothetical protein EW093_17160 (plasmid) [Thiospirochaeta perfilievii]|uniref:Uncharacterized protein n=1 Tax=Thiospirochaeta perfilievii TaxID=252967 RepID=A0A5C1QG80_9SPIO|nr:hypothetical protein [Thiospirochaeta perfilievii]QEN06437.1 hypothetical protein EW093_17160 [Thiospirochaeta perfilievii]